MYQLRDQAMFLMEEHSYWLYLDNYYVMAASDHCPNYIYKLPEIPPVLTAFLTKLTLLCPSIVYIPVEAKWEPQKQLYIFTVLILQSCSESILSRVTSPALPLEMASWDE